MLSVNNCALCSPSVLSKHGVEPACHGHAMDTPREEFFKALNLSFVRPFSSTSSTYSTSSTSFSASFRPCLKERLRSAKSSKENTPPQSRRSTTNINANANANASRDSPLLPSNPLPIASQSSHSSSFRQCKPVPTAASSKVMILVRRTYYVEDSPVGRKEVGEPYSIKIRIQKPPTTESSSSPLTTGSIPAA